MDVETLRDQFPILRRTINGRPLVYLDNAATSLTPESVIAAEADYYRRIGGNVHRGSHALSEEATQAFEEARGTVSQFLGAASAREVIFTANATGAMNIVAGGMNLAPSDEVISTMGEHHSTLLPWSSRATLRLADSNVEEPVEPEALARLISPRTKAVVLAHASNVSGVLQPVAEICRRFHEARVPVVIDAAQSAPHVSLDVQGMACDFLVLSGHKMLGPTGIGVLYGKAEALERLTPVCQGGGTVASVSPQSHVLRAPPARLEPGTPNIAGALGLARACEFLHELGWDAITARCHALGRVLRGGLRALKGVRTLSAYIYNTEAEATYFVECLSELLEAFI
jgi:cysteine desulfurase / selenocysteine lyase